MFQDKIQRKHEYLTCLVEKAERKLYYEKTNEHINFNDSCEKEEEAEQELKEIRKELEDFEKLHDL